MAGAGTIGVGGAGSGVGVGGWQLYEHVINPTLDTQLSKENLKYSPVRVPLNEQIQTGTNQQFKFNNWDCIKKLFSSELVQKIKHEETTTPSSVTPTFKTIGEKTLLDEERKIYLTTPVEVTDELTTCALLDLREGHNKIYFKSEVVARDKNQGFVMWNGLSKTSSNSFNFEYRLLTFKKEQNTWKIDKGFAWVRPTQTNHSEEVVRDKLHVIFPKGHGWNVEKRNVGSEYATRKTWSGIGRVDKSAKTHLIDSLQMYMGSDNPLEDGITPEFFGSGGFWSPNSKAGYDNVDKMYVENEGWKKITSIKLGDSLKEWYNSFNEEQYHVGWLTCGQWSSSRKTYSQNDGWDKTMKEMCYRSPSTSTPT